MPRTQKWRNVVALIASGEPLESVADASIDAAKSGLDRVPKDPGFVVVLANIFKFVDSLRSNDPFRALQDEGFGIGDLSGTLDYTTSLREKTDSDLKCYGNDQVIGGGGGNRTPVREWRPGASYVRSLSISSRTDRCRKTGHDQRQPLNLDPA